MTATHEDSSVPCLEDIRHSLGHIREQLSRPPGQGQGTGLSLDAGLYFRRLLDVSRRMSSTLDLRGVLDVAIETLVELFAAEKGFLIVLDEEGKLEFDVAVDAADGSIEDASKQVSLSIVQEVIGNRMPVLVGDALEDDRFKDKTSVMDLGLRSAMCVPLTGREGVVGAIYVDHRVVAGRFGEGDLELLSLFGNHVGTAIENARLFEAQRRRAGGMELLYSVGHAALEQLSRETMLTTMLRQITDRGFGDAAVMLVGEPLGSGESVVPRLCVRAHSGLDEAFIGESNWEALASLVGGGSVASPVANLPDGVLRDACQANGLLHLAVVALDPSGGLRGFVVVVRKGAPRFSADDMELFRIVASEVRLALQNLTLYRQLQEANDELRQAQEQILREERLRALGTMASGVAHDVNNVLTPVLSYSDLLLADEALDTRTRERVGMIWTAARDMARIVTRLREFYRKREHPHLMGPVLVSRLMERTVSLTRPHWHDLPQRRGVVVHVEQDVPADIPAILGDEAELREALTNLVLNAVDAMPEGGRLCLRARARDARVELQVIDTGVGMDETVRKRCFEPFFSTKLGVGTGMGTSVVHGIVRRHNGEIGIESRPGHGTTFTILLPATEGNLLPCPPPRVPVRSCRILCIDDEPVVRQSLKDALVHEGHTVDVADGGEAGITAFGEGRYDVVITDLGMPNVDGCRTASAVKRLSPETPVILLTGWASELPVEEGASSDIDCVVSKPFSLADLHGALLKVLGPGDAREGD